MGVEVTDYKTKKINSLTGGMIGEFRLPDYPEDTFDDGVLRHSFLSKKGDYIGDYGRGWWYVKWGLKVCDEHPIGVAEQWDNGKLVGYCGYSHRGACVFVVGDRLFDERYEPIKEDYDEAQWKEWEKEFLDKRENGDDFDREMIYDNISSVIPFKMRGKKEILTLEDAMLAAINLSKYLS